MATARHADPLVRLVVAGVAGLPELDLELGPMTALVGQRGSGKSQLLASIAWLMTGRPRIVAAAGAATTVVSGQLRDGGPVGVARSEARSRAFARARRPRRRGPSDLLVSPGS